MWRDGNSRTLLLNGGKFGLQVTFPWPVRNKTQRSFDATPRRKLFSASWTARDPATATTLQTLPRRRTDRVIDGTNAELAAMPVAVKPRSPRSGAPQAQGLTAIRSAEAQLAVPFGEASTNQPRYVVAAHPRRTCDPYHPEPPTVSAGEPE